MMAMTHRAFAATFWTGTALTADLVATRQAYPAPVGLPDLVLGIAVAPLFSSGNRSPDIDRQWAPGWPSRDYDWQGHRGWTHRVWFASVLMSITGLAQFGQPAAAGVLAVVVVLGVALVTRRLSVVFWMALVCAVLAQPLQLAAAWAPVAGWWSHDAGDLIYGKLKVAGRIIGLGLKTDGFLESGRFRLLGKRRHLPVKPGPAVAIVATAGLLWLFVPFVPGS